MIDVLRYEGVHKKKVIYIYIYIYTHINGSVLDLISLTRYKSPLL